MRIILITLVLLGTTLYGSFAHAKACASDTELAALDTRALQTELMVSALACGEQSRYNSFVKKFQSLLSTQSNGIKGYFGRVYHSSADKQLNRFITSLANQASQISLTKSEDSFCNEASELLDEVLDSRPKDIAVIAANTELAQLHGVSSCY